MRKTSALTWTLLLLVLLPSGILAWLGLRSVGALDADRVAALGQERDRARDELARLEPQSVAAVDAHVRERIEPVARELEASLPGRTPREQAKILRQRAVELSRRGLSVVSIELLDAAGRVLLPARHIGLASRGSARDTSLEALVGHLAVKADRAYYTGAGPAEALSIWRRAEEAASTDSLRMRLAVEGARVEARAGRDVAVKAAAALEARWPRESLLEVGRPVLLLWLAGTGPDADTLGSTHPVNQRIDLVARTGAVDGTPLTSAERARFRALMSYPDPRVDPVQPAIPFAVELAGGARLVFRVRTHDVSFILKRHLKDVWGTVESYKRIEVLRVAAGTVMVRRQAQRPGHVMPVFYEASSWVVLHPLPGGTTVPLHVHVMQSAVDATSESLTWRVGTYAAIAMLMLITLSGAFLMRRAVLREREARRVRDDFIANVTHEVRTPLTSVLLHSELLIEQGEDDAKRRQHAAVVQAQGQRLAALVGDMLDFAALERGTRTLENSPVDLAAACRDAIAPYQVLAEREGAEVTFVEPGRETAAMADPAALARILGNLVGNAWKHGRPSRDGHAGRLRILTAEDARGGIVEVRDDGPGIPAEERGRVFERFGRGRAALRKEGSGIGLSLSRDLARAMGGDLTIHEEQGETVFRLRLAPVPELDLE